mmetsp:Transcript_946/g.2815  ORF Transcript_946/g.2815 Transcript_946/m.2815 type:complete len:398 (-) Transcript_946:1278-2471(-)
MQVLRPEREQTSREPSARLTLHEPDGQLGSEPVRDEEGGKDARQEADAPPLVVVDELPGGGVVVSLRVEVQDGSTEVCVDLIQRQGVLDEVHDVLVAPEGGVQKLVVRRIAHKSREPRASLGEDLLGRQRGYLQKAAHDVVDVEGGRGALQVAQASKEPHDLADAHRIFDVPAQVDGSVLKLVDHERREPPPHVRDEHGPAPPHWDLGQEAHDGDVQQRVHGNGPRGHLDGGQGSRDGEGDHNGRQAVHKVGEHEEEERPRGAGHSPDRKVQDGRVTDGGASDGYGLNAVVGADVADRPVAPVVGLPDEHGLVYDQARDVDDGDQASDEHGDEKHGDHDDEALGRVGVWRGVERVDQEAGHEPQANPRRDEERVGELTLALVGEDGQELRHEPVRVE